MSHSIIIIALSFKKLHIQNMYKYGKIIPPAVKTWPLLPQPALPVILPFSVILNERSEVKNPLHRWTYAKARFSCGNPFLSFWTSGAKWRIPSDLLLLYGMLHSVQHDTLYLSFCLFLSFWGSGSASGSRYVWQSSNPRCFGHFIPLEWRMQYTNTPQKA